MFGRSNSTRRFLAGVAVGLVGFLAVVYAVMGGFLEREFGTLESADVTRRTRQVTEVFEREFQNQVSAVVDYAVWDSAVEYMAGRDPTWFQRECPPTALAEMGQNAILFVDLDGRVVGSAGVNIQTKQPGPVDSALIAAIEATPVLTRHTASDERDVGLLRVGEQVALVGAAPIVASSAGGPARGTLLFVRVIDDAFKTTFAKTTGSPLTLDVLPPGSAAILDPLIDRVSDDVATGTLTVADVTGAPLYRVTASVDRAFWHQGQHARHFLLQTLTLAGVLCLLVISAAAWRQARAEHRHRRAEALFRAALDTMGEGVLFIDVRTQRAVEANHAARRLLGVADSPFPSTPLSELINGEPAIVGALCDAVADGKSVDRMELGMWGTGRQVFPIELSVSPVLHEGQRLAAVLFRDITDRRKAQERARFFAYHDPLTGLPNRLLFQDRLTVALAQAGRAEECVGVVFLDVDHFKEVNDTLGHDTGDELIKQVAVRLRGNVRTGDTVARQGGDEFMVLLPRLHHDEETHLVAERLTAVMSQPFHVGLHELRVSASIGVAVFPVDGRDAETLVKNADVAMYQSKERGRNGYTLFDPALNARVASLVEMKQRLKRAIDDHEFELHYQPQVHSRTGRIVGFEALIRWKTEDLGWIPPMQFIPLAEETGLILPLGNWVMAAACRQMKDWQRAGLDVGRVAVNVSAKQLADRTFADVVRRALASSQLGPEFLEVEVTETMAMKDPDATRRVLAEIKATGVTIALDDFGSGYSSLAYLRRFPFDRLKMDREFIRDLADSASEQSLVQSIVSLAASLGLEVVAEGVETTEQLRILCTMGCDILQGYGLARPMPAADVPAFITQSQPGGVDVTRAISVM